MAFKVIVYLVVSIISVLLAVAIFVKFWNAFIGADATQRDAQALASLIEEMVREESQYETRPFLLQLQENTIIGFDQSDPRSVTLGSITYQADRACDGGPCLCKANEEGVERCFDIDTPDGVYVQLESDYRNFGSYSEPAFPQYLEALRKGGEDKDAPPTEYIMFFAREDFFRDGYAFLRTLSGNRDVGTPQVIYPVVIEKHNQTIDGATAIYITILPESPYAHGRAYFHQRCGEGSEASCIGMTGKESYADGKYCAVNPFNAKCTQVDISACANGVEVIEPCLCGDEVVASGFCTVSEAGTQWSYFQFNCEGVLRCEDYCERDLAAGDMNEESATTISYGHVSIGQSGYETISRDNTYKNCRFPEYALCTGNPCGMPKGCGITGNADNGYYCNQNP